MKSKMAALFASVLIALAVVGFTYAWWTETLTISGTITTGELDVEFTGAYTSSCSEYMSCSVNFEDGGETDPTPGDLSKMEVTVSNGYPCGWCNVTFTIHNCGTIPAKVTAINIPTVAGLEISVEGISVGTQINPSQNVSPTLKIHVAESASMNSQYTFTVTIVFGQWNQP
jgi:predicted ribosomally synthesized peptide with SipW-like signal peptide